MTNGQRDELKRLTEMVVKGLDENQNEESWTNARFMRAVHQISSLMANVCKDIADIKNVAA